MISVCLPRKGGERKEIRNLDISLEFYVAVLETGICCYDCRIYGRLGGIRGGARTF